MFHQVEISYYLLRRLLGVKTAEGEPPLRPIALHHNMSLAGETISPPSPRFVCLWRRRAPGTKQAKVSKLTKGEILMVNIGSTSTGGKVAKVLDGANGEPIARISLTQPVCTQEAEKIALSRRVDKHWRLIGWGEIRKGLEIEMNGTFQASAGGDDA